MRSFLLLLSCAFALPAFADKPQAELDMSTSGEIVIAADGSVASHELDPGLAPVVKDLVDRNVRTWRFEPILVDGQPRPARTRMQLALRALPNEEGNYTLRLENVWFGVTKPNPRNRPPAYPRSAISARVGARLMVVAKLDARGNVVDVHPYQTSLDRQTRGDGMARRLRGMFERAGLAAVKGWKFTPGEMINGEAIGGSVMVPIWFQITENGRKPSESEWRAYVPGPISPAPWITEESLAQIDTNALGEGDSASLESRFRLTSDVVGKAL